MSRDGPPPIEAQVLFADSRAPGPISATVGWKVKDVFEAPGSQQLDRSLLLAVDAIGQVYVPDIDRALAHDSANAPPVLKHLRVDREVMALANFADAGIDRTGRPTHTMHALLHTAPLRSQTGGFRRPIELFGSPMWVRPIGEAEIETASVQGRSFGLAAGPLDLDAVVGDAFLTNLDHPGRVLVLPLVLEAFRAALDDNSTVVLVVADPRESAAWLALLSNLIDPVSASRLRFSTREDLLAASTADSWDHHLVGVVPSTSAGSRGEEPLGSLATHCLVVDTRRPPVERSGSWVIAGGRELRRSVWTEIAETVLLSPVVTEGVRARLDQLGDEVSGIDAAPTWALAVAALLTGADLPDPAAAVLWVFERWPVDARLSDAVVEELGDVLARAIGTSPSLQARLSGQLGTDVPSFLADAVLVGAVRAALSGPHAPGTMLPASRALSGDAARAVERDLPQILEWLSEERAETTRLAGVLHVLEVARGAGLSGPRVLSALMPFLHELVACLVDVQFSPIRNLWPPMPTTLWSGGVGDLVSDALFERENEVSGDTHEYLTPSIGDGDEPAVAVQHRSFQLSAYGCRRAVWRGPGADTWSKAVFAVGMMHVHRYRYGRPVFDATQRAIDLAFRGEPVPVAVAGALVDLIETSEFTARCMVAGLALSDGQFRQDQRQLAMRLRDDVEHTGTPLDPYVVPTYLQLVHDDLVRGTPERALTGSWPGVAQSIASGLETIESPVLQDAARHMVLCWGLRVPVWTVRSPEGPPPDLVTVQTLWGVIPTSELLDRALFEILSQDDATVVEVLSELMVRATLALYGDRAVADDDPYARWLARGRDVGEPLLFRGPIRTWLLDRGQPAFSALESRWAGVVDKLAARGWHRQAGNLDTGRVEMLAAMQDKPSSGKRRKLPW